MGQDEQPGSTYYLQKVSHDIFGIVDHRDEKSVAYLFDERIGPKNTDHSSNTILAQRLTQTYLDQSFSYLSGYFTIDELKVICDTCSTCHIEKGDAVHKWRDSLTLK